MNALISYASMHRAVAAVFIVVIALGLSVELGRIIGRALKRGSTPYPRDVLGEPDARTHDSQRRDAADRVRSFPTRY